MKLLRVSVAVLLFAGLIAGGVYWRVTTKGPPLTSADPDIRLEERACPKKYPNARCGVIFPPLDYADPDGPRIEVGFVYLPPVAPAFGDLRVVQAVSGGPGAAITPALKPWKFARWPFRLRAPTRGVLGVDPRGVGRMSTLLSCEVLTEVSFLKPEALKACAAEIGDQHAFYSTANTARDFDLVRRALGIKSIDMYAFSYGTNLATVYVSMYSEHVRTLALDGAYPILYPDLHPSFHAALQRQFRQFCERSGDCDTEDALNALAWAADELRAAPRTLTPKANVAYRTRAPVLDAPFLAGLAAASPRYDRAKGGRVAAHFPVIGGLLAARDDGDWSILEALALGALEDDIDRSIERGGGMANALRWSIDCDEMAVPWDRTADIETRRAQLLAVADAFPTGAFAPFTPREWAARYNGEGLNHYHECMDWPGPVEGHPTELRHELGAPRPDLPVLILNGDYDMATPDEDAMLAQAQFPNAQLALFAHHGHVVMPHSACAPGLWREFFRNKTVKDPMRCYDADAVGAAIDMLPEPPPQ